MNDNAEDLIITSEAKLSSWKAVCLVASLIKGLDIPVISWIRQAADNDDCKFEDYYFKCPEMQ